MEHYINSLLVANRCQLYAPPSGPGKDVPSILAELKAYAAAREIPKGELIIGYSYDDLVMPNGRLLNRDDLDEAFPDNPVRVDHVSMQGTVMNRMALQKYGISSETKTPAGGVIVRKPGTDEPWGLIMETAYLPVVEKAEPMTAQQEIATTRAGQMLYAAAGVTTAHEGASHLPQIQTIKRATEAGANLIDVVAFPFSTFLDSLSQLGTSVCMAMHLVRSRPVPWSRLRRTPRRFRATKRTKLPQRRESTDSQQSRRLALQFVRFFCYCGRKPRLIHRAEFEVKAMLSPFIWNGSLKAYHLNGFSDSSSCCLRKS